MTATAVRVTFGPFGLDLDSGDGRRQLLSPVNDNYFCRCWGIEECGAT
jgi:hypothetical protein